MAALAGKVCVVTGGASGLGLEITNLLVEKGARVIVIDVDEKLLAGLIENPEIVTKNCDVTNESNVESTIGDIVAKQGKIDVLVNNVGILYSAPLFSFGPNGVQKHDSAMWDKVLATNLSSAFYMSKHVVEAMFKKRTKGIIVNISSVSARGNAGQSAYSAAKAGLEALTKVWAKELAPIGIRCFAVAPGFCETPSTHAAVSQQILTEVVGKVPLKRLGKPAEVAALVVAGIENDFLTGSILEINGGLVV